MGEVKKTRPRTESLLCVGEINFRMHPQEIVNYCIARGIKPAQYFDELKEILIEHFDEWYLKNKK